MNDINIGRGIATAAIWFAVGFVGYVDHSGVVAILAITAVVATGLIWRN